MSHDPSDAPGWPGIPPRWTSSAKSGVGTTLDPSSPVWFTLSHGIVNEVYYPRVDQACTRDLGLIVTDGAGFFSEEKRDTVCRVETLADGVPAYRLVNRCTQGRYQIEKTIFTDPTRGVLLHQMRFVPLVGRLADYRVHVLLAPHLGNRGDGNTAWVGDYQGVPMLFAQRNAHALALAASVPWGKRSAGFVGVSDGWQDLAQHGQMTWTYSRAENGNVALCAELLLTNTDGQCLLALGLGSRAYEAGHRARAALLDDFDRLRLQYTEQWQAWQHTLRPLDDPPATDDLYRTSTAVMRTHESKHLPGGIIASLSIPWGHSKSDDDLGGYHLIWPRDLCETAGGLLAAGALEDVRRVLDYLRVTQHADGHWSQNMWIDGEAYWPGQQMDETALPILLVDLAAREGLLGETELAVYWPMVRRAACYVVANGPVTQEDRWEEDPGYSPFTLAAEVAALVVAADLARRVGESELVDYLLQTADAWNDSIESWIYATGTELARRVGVAGYYVRIAPPEVAEGASPAAGFVPIKNRPPGLSDEPAAQIVSPDALALVRFGLRRADDPRIVNTLRVVDALLKLDTPAGPCWHRYNDDGYGEHADGSPFDGTGIGRAWPLLTGERAHYELAAGRRDEATRLLAAMQAFASDGGMIPEQIWDAPDIPQRELYLGRPSGSAMPLVWAHAEYTKLRRSLRDGQVFDMPPQTVERYLIRKVGSPHAVWRFNQKRRTMPEGRILRIEVLAPAVVHWSLDGWRTVCDTPTRPTACGIHLADLPTQHLAPGGAASFTLFWTDANRWEGADFYVGVT